MKFIKKITSSDFSRNVLTLMTGTTVAQAIPIAITPILTRLYTPEDFGVLALFLSIVAITGVLSGFQYAQGIVLPKDDEEASLILQLSFLIVTVFSLILLIAVFFFADDISNLLNNREIKNWLYFVPISTFLVGVYNSLNYFNIRLEEYKRVAKSQVYRSSSLASVQLLIGFFSKTGPLGLVLGQLSSYFTGNTILYKKVAKFINIKELKKTNLKKTAVKYKKFPLFSLPSIFINTLNINVVNFLISTFFSVKTLGFYNITQRVVGVPSRIFGQSFSQVYYQKGNLIYREHGIVEPIFKATLKKLLLIATPVFLILFFTVEHVFTFFFGADWELAGEYVKILIPLAFTRFISSSLSNTITIYEKQEYGVFINLSLLICTVVVFFLANQLSFSFKQTLILYTIVLSILYCIFLFIYWNLSKKINLNDKTD